MLGMFYLLLYGSCDNNYSLFICTGHLSVFTYIMTLCGFMHMAYHVAVALFV